MKEIELDWMLIYDWIIACLAIFASIIGILVLIKVTLENNDFMKKLDELEKDQENDKTFDKK